MDFLFQCGDQRPILSDGIRRSHIRMFRLDECTIVYHHSAKDNAQEGQYGYDVGDAVHSIHVSSAPGRADQR